MFATQPPPRPLWPDAARRGLASHDEHEPLARHTTFRDRRLRPTCIAEAADRGHAGRAGASWPAEHGVPLLVLGGGSNVLVSDAGVRGLVIAQPARHSLAHPGGAAPAPTSRIPTAQIVAESGAALAGLARWAIRAGWAGLEWAVSVPGTVGGAVIGNAGAHGGDMAGNLAWCEVSATRRRAAPSDRCPHLALRLSHQPAQAGAGGGRSAPPVVLRAGFGLTPGDPAALTAIADAFLARRRATQPVEPSAGSIFRNPPGDHAGRLVEATGLKGHRIGGAQISPRHANFIVNDAAQRRPRTCWR